MFIAHTQKLSSQETKIRFLYYNTSHELKILQNGSFWLNDCAQLPVHARPPHWAKNSKDHLAALHPQRPKFVRSISVDPT